MKWYSNVHHQQIATLLYFCFFTHDKTDIVHNGLLLTILLLLLQKN